MSDLAVTEVMCCLLCSLLVDCTMWDAGFSAVSTRCKEYVQGLLSSEHACEQCHMIKKGTSGDSAGHDIEGAVVHPASREGLARGLQARFCSHAVY